MAAKKETTRKRRTKKEEAPKSNRLAKLADRLSESLGSESFHLGGSGLCSPRIYIPSLIPDLDQVLDREGRGWAGGRIVELYGASATSKTGIGYALGASCQQQGGDFILIPAEGNVDEWLLRQYGVDLDTLLIVDKNTVEEIFFFVKKVLEDTETPTVIMIDSLAGMCTKEEFESDTFERDRAAQLRAFLTSKALRKISTIVPKTNTILFMINQVREGATVGVLKQKDKPTGGHAIGFYCDIRIRLENIGRINRTKAGKKYVAGFKLRATAEKNRLAEPFATSEFMLDFDKGMSSMPEKKTKKKSAGGET